MMRSHKAEHGEGGSGREGGSFNENIYEDEPEVIEIEVKEALRHISNRKSAGCDGMPMELLKAGGWKR